MENDAELLRSLQAITGDAAVWNDFDPSAWRSLVSEGEAEGEGSSAAEAAGADDQEVDYASDDSAGIIFNLHKLTPAEKDACSGNLNKVRQYASGETAFPRELAELEKIKWKETGLAKGDVSAEGDTFVPFRLVQHYPDMFIGKANAPRVSDVVIGLCNCRGGCADLFARLRRCLRSTLSMRTESGICKPSYS
jgi:hypothetical protein